MRKNRLLAAVLTGSILSSVLLGGCGKAETVRAAEDTTSEEVAVTEVSDPSEPEQKSETDPEDDVVVRIGQLTGHLLPVVASEKGFFEEEGVKVELYTFGGGPAEIEAFTA